MNDLKEYVCFSAKKPLVLWRLALLGDLSCTDRAWWLLIP